MLERLIGCVRWLSVGTPRASSYRGEPVWTGIYKTLSAEPLWLGRLNFTGDRQGDLENHGGPDKAVCVYPFEHYAFWRAALGLDLVPAAFGENLTTQGLDEASVCLGDRWRIGSAYLEVTQPRQPCYKLAMRWGVEDLPERIRATGRSGFYLRVLEEGQVAPGDEIRLVMAHPARVSIQMANAVIHQRAHGRQGLEQVLAVESIAASLRRQLSKRLHAADAGATP